MGLPGVSVVKSAPVNAGEADLTPGWEDSPEKEMAAHFNILAWEIPWTEASGGLQSMGSQKVGHNLATDYTQY